jgi:hypothetical protein
MPDLSNSTPISLLRTIQGTYRDDIKGMRKIESFDSNMESVWDSGATTEVFLFIPLADHGKTCATRFAGGR